MFIQAQELRTAYDESGSGVPLLFIHGYPLTRKLWAPQLAGLKETARSLAPDLRGFGETEATPGPYSMELLAGDCAAFLDALGVERAVVCGLSMGGYIALAFARLFPERLSGLVLTATRAGPDSPAARDGRDQAITLVQRSGVEEVAQSMLPRLLAPGNYEARPELVERVRELLRGVSAEGVVGALQGMRDRPDSTPFLQKIQVPTLILHGEEDPIIPLSEAEAMRAAIPQARLETLPEAGHLPNLEQPERFNAAVAGFLAEL